MAAKNFEIENGVSEQTIYKFDEDENDKIFDSRPWTKDPMFFNSVKISVTALIKMVSHAKSGGDLEIMGLMQGKILDRAFYVLDSFALPIVGTETNVNPGQECLGYIGDMMDTSEKVGRLEQCCGWYHSHPGYRPYLSGTDCGTQRLYQQTQEPWLAIVIDPKTTSSSGRVDLGCFRVYPEGYKGPGVSTNEIIPQDKIEDFGIHANEYYKIDY